MLTLPGSVRVFVTRTPVDFRKSHDGGLFGVVTHVLDENPRSGHLFVFFNKRRDRIKIIVHDGSGLWLFFTSGSSMECSIDAAPRWRRREGRDRHRQTADVAARDRSEKVEDSPPLRCPRT
jgi:hypothetical protein